VENQSETTASSGADIARFLSRRIKVMKSNIVRSIALLFGLMLVPVQMAKAETVILLEDFESYADTAAMGAAWNLNGVGIGPHNFLDTVVGNAGKSLRCEAPASNSLGRLIRNLPGGAISVNATTNLVMSVDMLLADAGAPGWNGARHFCEIRSYTGGSFNCCPLYAGL